MSLSICCLLIIKYLFNDLLDATYTWFLFFARVHTIIFSLYGTSSDTILTQAAFCTALRKVSSLRWLCDFLPNCDVQRYESLQTAIALEQLLKETIFLQFLAVQSSQQTLEGCKEHVAWWYNFWRWKYVHNSLHNFLAFSVVSYKYLKDNTKSISTKDECDGNFYATRKVCITMQVTLIAMPFKIITCFIDIFIY